jgi:hypothetical protein
MHLILDLWKDEQGQDLIEYTLLMAFVALASAGLFLGAGYQELTRTPASAQGRFNGRDRPLRW